MLAIVATWNRCAELRRCLDAIRGQDADAAIEILVVDNASEDGTTETLGEEMPGAAMYRNLSSSGMRPAFEIQREHSPTQRGEDLTIVRSRRNLGGTGGFNTGLSFVYKHRSEVVDYVWLVDDDAVVGKEALGWMLRAAESDSGIGLVGARTVRLDDPAVTLESTIYFDPMTGFMRDAPPVGHRMEATFRSEGIDQKTSGVVEVDVVSACSMLARWRAAAEVGPWDEDFFLYCDDADWCLRFQARGWRIVNCLDSTVGHSPWHEKLTPVREYYAKRNAFWMHQRALRGLRRRMLTLRWSVRLLRESVRRWKRGERVVAWMTARAVVDALLNRGGPLSDSGRGSAPSAVAYWTTVLVGGGIAGLVWPWKRRRRSPRWAPAGK